MVAAQTPILTLGQQGRTTETLLALLQQHAVAYLIDVRHRQSVDGPLDVALRTVGIRYVDLAAALTDRPADPAVYRNGTIDLAAVRNRPAFQHALGRLQTAYAQGHALALLGDVAEPAACHRSTLIGAALHEAGIPVVHMAADGRLINHAALFAPPAFDDDVPEEPAWLAELGWDDFPPADDDPYAEELPPGSGGALLPLADARAKAGESPRAVLKRVFGFDAFRPLQQQIVDHVLAGRDALVIMPTGGGKSMCYQLPALLLDGMTVVVSPLIALMQDQVGQLRDWGIAAHFLNSTLAYSEAEAIAAQVRAGQVRLLYVAPETLLRPQTLTLLAGTDVSLLAIDEAHCISQWGHDFRPEYRRLVDVRHQMPDATCIALTATAPPRVRDDIRASLALSDDETFVSSFDRPNLFIEVAAKGEMAWQTRDFIRARPGESGIVYCSTIKTVEALSKTLQNAGLSVLPYHGQMDAVTRRNNQTAFVRDDVQVIVATIAFGMGIDKPNVRWILHADLPQGMEQYYQQIGRAGRDGLRADCLLLYSYRDVIVQASLIDKGAPGEREGRSRRLQALADWAQSRQCRRRPLLAYFGEQFTATNCGMCDNCTRQDDEAQVDLTREAQMFLSCVYRTGQMFGAAHIIDVLRGSRARRVIEKRHDRLSTYGIGSDLSTDTWKSLAQQFIDRGLLTRDMEVGSLKLTKAGVAVLKGDQPFMGLAAPAPRIGGTQGGPDIAYEGALFEQLRALRKQLADERNVPPYVVFSDRTLQEMAAYFPQSEASLLAIYGVGSAKLTQYADTFLSLIRAYCAANGLTERQPPQNAAPPASDMAIRGRTQTIGDAVVNGWMPAALADDLGIKLGTVLGHLSDYIEAGYHVPEDALTSALTLAPAQQEAVLRAYAELGDQFLRPVFDHFEGNISFDDLKVMRMIFRLRR